jgi:hypothetical protein
MVLISPILPVQSFPRSILLLRLPLQISHICEYLNLWLPGNVRLLLRLRFSVILMNIWTTDPTSSTNVASDGWIMHGMYRLDGMLTAEP